MSHIHQYTIRAILPKDIQALILLCAEHAAYERASYQSQGKAERLTIALFSSPPRLYGWVVERNGELVGYATASQEYSTWDAMMFLHMDCLYVREEVRGLGLGRQLIQEIATLACKLGCSTIQWQTPEWNEGAIRFYQRLGASSREKIRFTLAGDKLTALAI